MSRVFRILFGFRTDIDLNQRWWHRLAKVAYVLGLVALGFWAAGIGVDFPDGDNNIDNIRIVETLADFTKAHPSDGDPVDSFYKKYYFTSGILSWIVLNLYYRGFVYIVCGPLATGLHATRESDQQ